MQIIKWLMKKAEKKYNGIDNFYSKFEVQVPSLQYKLYKTYPNHKWITFLIINLTQIGFFIFWLASLYYISSVLNICENKMTLFNLQFNGNCTDYNCSAKIYNLLNDNLTDLVVKK